ncbi:hypothetical protein [Fibrobacter sp. UBA4297]|uniref:hypothetical protein n=1 Tax=Fibrobacter sp. UBA4297 TaxID=1946536 RepID=UPI0025BF5674|nr:hypothetical protein [Fibrobacter sp. UBA4297]
MFNLYPQLTNLVAWLYDIVNCGAGFEGTAAVSGIILVALILSLVVIGILLNLVERLEFAFFCYFFGYKAAFYLVNHVTIPGTILHELSHALLATITGAKVNEVSFFDRDKNSLGHVTYQAKGPFFLQAVQHSLTACAPVIVGLASFALVSYFLLTTKGGFWTQTLLIYLGISIINHSSMSIADLKLYFKGVWAPAIPLFVIIFIFCKTAHS